MQLRRIERRIRQQQYAAILADVVEAAFPALRRPVFGPAMHQQGVRFADDEEVLNWVAKAGIDRARFTETYRSMGVQSRVRRAASMMNDYKIDHWPMMALCTDRLNCVGDSGSSLARSLRIS